MSSSRKEKLVGNRAAGLRQGLTPFSLDGTQDLAYLPDYDLMEHYKRCDALNDARYPCKLALYILEKNNPDLHTASR